MSVVATKAISAKLFVGTFELRSHLVDHATEEMANDIIAEVNKVMNAYQERNPQERIVTPRFAFGGVEGSSHKIELYVMAPGTPNTQMGTVHLKWAKVDGCKFERLVIRKTTQARQAKIEHLNASFTLPELKTALSIRQISLNDERNELLAHHLDYFETMHRKHPATFTFDLELNDEGITVVAFRDFQRHSAITAFAQ
ncbi:hypothetical protein [Burkholderia phage FLC9]|nr:hypothetical protein [Burkholderia phage FLC9]